MAPIKWRMSSPSRLLQIKTPRDGLLARIASKKTGARNSDLQARSDADRSMKHERGGKLMQVPAVNFVVYTREVFIL